MIDNSLWKTAVDLQHYLADRELPFCFIGGIAVQRWGQPRVTVDVDATILVPFGKESTIAEEILARYQSRIDAPIAFAIQARILLLRDIQNNNIDLSIGGLDYEHRLVERSSMWGLTTGQQIRTCGAEDLIILKTFASRDQDWIDVKTVLARQSSVIDRNLVINELRPLAELKEEPEITERLLALFRELPD